MKPLCAMVALFVTVSCSSTPRLKSPVALSDAILTLPSQAVAGMSKTGRREYLLAKSGDFDENTRRLHLYGDNWRRGWDAESMLFLRLFEDDKGRTIAACHSARPFAVGSTPSDSDTHVYRLESGEWVDVTSEVLPADVPRSWWFRFDEDGDSIPCGPYIDLSRRDWELRAYRFGDPSGHVFWHHGSFQYSSKALRQE